MKIIDFLRIISKLCFNVSVIARIDIHGHGVKSTKLSQSASVSYMKNQPSVSSDVTHLVGLLFAYRT
jgi:hypothetical protein